MSLLSLLSSLCLVSIGDFLKCSVCAQVTWKCSLRLVYMPVFGFFLNIRPLQWTSAMLVLANLKVNICLLSSKYFRPKRFCNLWNFLEGQVLWNLSVYVLGPFCPFCSESWLGPISHKISAEFCSQCIALQWYIKNPAYGRQSISRPMWIVAPMP